MVKAVDFLTKIFEENRNDATAGPMEKYMKDHFPFLGIKKPLRNELEKQFFKVTAGHCGSIQRQIPLQ